MRQGKDVTILCYSRMRYVVMQAVQQLEKMGYDPEVHAPRLEVQGRPRSSADAGGCSLCMCDPHQC